MTESSIRWGIDLGGTKIEAVVLEDGRTEPISRLRIPTEAAQGYDHILSQISTLVDLVRAETGLPMPATVGVGTPGTTGQNGLLKNSNTVCLNGMPFRADLVAKLGCEVICSNDANCFALAEATMGAAKGFDNVFGVILGTGVGGGIVIKRQVVNGRMGIAGEWGHNTLEPTGTPCYCGKVGCVETVLAGPSLERFYNSLTGNTLMLPEILKRARSNSDGAAVATLDRLISKFGEAIAVVINILDPEVIVLGGGVGNVSELLTLGKQAILPHLFNPVVETEIIQPSLGDSAGVFGAAMLAG